MVTDLVGTVFEIFQYASLFISVLAIYFLIKRAILNKQWMADIPLLLSITHTIIYYIVLFLVRAGILSTPPLFFTSWSTVLRFHILFSIFFIAFTGYARERCKWGRS